MTNIMNCLVGLENATKAHRPDMAAKDVALRQAYDTLDSCADGMIVLDPKLDPDPYGYHGIPLSTRFAAMGWPQ